MATVLWKDDQVYLTPQLSVIFSAALYSLFFHALFYMLLDLEMNINIISCKLEYI